MNDEAPMTKVVLPAGSAISTTGRRSFLIKAAAVVIGVVVSIFPLAVGLLAFFDPLRRKSEASSFVRIAPLEAVPVDGVPRRFAVLADRTDAWNRFRNEPVGAVYLRRSAGNKIEALNSICPHAGCFVDFNEPARCFKCPCHNSTFTMDGGIIQPSPSPRPMDTLAVEVRDQGGSKEVWVQFENFYTGIAEKVLKA
jgi:menaquinol-cytochrome c reductase iron-sulfur subunit